MGNIARRDFIRTAAGLTAIAFTGTSFEVKDKLLLSFSTLGCPDWPFERIVNFAEENGYSGIELRGIQRELNLTKCAEFSTPEKIGMTMKLMQQKRLEFVDLGSSASLHHLDVAERQKNLDEARTFIDLAHALHCPYIRVFPNNLPKEQDHNATIDIIIKSLLELGDHAKGSGVTVLMESHGDLVNTTDLVKIMHDAEHENIGLVWDIVNMWSVTKQPPAEVYGQLKKYIRHTHIKDLKLVDGKEQYTLVGKGESPIFEAIDILRKGNYKGYYSFEWEKLWHPEIAEPEIAIADYAKVMREHFKA
jgi:sugar phosphate isomerase/epimerase